MNFFEGVWNNLFIFMSCTLCWMKMSSTETQEMWGVGTAIHLSQWCLRSQPLVSAWDAVLSTDPGHFQSCTLCFAEANKNVERAALFWLPWGMTVTILWRWDSGQGLPRSHWRQRRGREKEAFVYLPWTSLGLGACLCHSKSCPFSPPLPPITLFPDLPFLPTQLQTSPPSPPHVLFI